MDINKLDLKSKTVEELYKIELNLEKDLFDIRFNKVFSAIKDLTKISKLKKMISRVKTLKTKKINSKKHNQLKS